MLRLIPGAVDRNALRALVLAPKSATVTVTIDGAPPTSLTPVVPNPSRLAEELDSTRVFLQLLLVVAERLSPETSYRIEATTNTGLSKTTTVKTLPTRESIVQNGLTFLLSGCYYSGFNKAPGYLAAMKAAKCYFGDPAFKLLLGDNLYLDVTKGQRGFDRKAYRETVAEYKKYFYDRSYAEVLEYLPTFTCWDDHEFWNNYPEWQIHLSRTWDETYDDYKAAALDCLAAFQKPLNPPAVASGHSYIIDADPFSIFVADLRADRELNTKGVMMKAEDLLSLEGWLEKTNKGPKMLVVGQPLWMEKGGRMSDYNPPDYPEHYQRIWQAIAGSAGGLIIISSDVHHSRILELEIAGKRVIEFVTSPACHIPTNGSIFRNSYNTQGEGAISFPDKVEIEKTPKPSRIRYLAGSTAQNTFAMMQLRPYGANGLEAQWAFIDSNATPGFIAASAKRNTGSLWWKKELAPKIPKNLGTREHVLQVR